MNVACDMCSETFIGQVGLKMHKARMHAEKIKCTICSAKFVSIAALNRHTDTAGEHGALRPCEQCGENCASEQALQEHVKDTHPTESHRCEECGMTFPTLSAYDVHHRRKHLNQRYSDAGRQRHTTRKKYPQTHKQGQFVCETCGKLMQVSANSPSQPALQRRRPPAAHDTQEIPANTQAGPVRVRDLRETHAG
ncbi:zinc finger protein 354A-like isoform X2 [Cydia fagiglandana]|uniref:zinc finger protein 354A-like isoform X1 n=1 Tax=Cydia fagiglandana TaxID=1458189 RepID=UPI002FEE39F9